jgi:HSP20 family protein
MSMNLIPFRRHHSLSHPAANSLFDDEFFRPFFDMGEMFGSSGFRVDIKDKKDHYELDAELPGVNQEQIELTCDKGILTISANMNTETREEQKDYIYSERRMGRFQRSFDLEGIKEEAITARYHDGVLTVNLPKKEGAEEVCARRIPIGE